MCFMTNTVSFGSALRSPKSHHLTCGHLGSSVIRIAPNELHIRKPELYKTIYSQSTAYYKPWSFYQSLSIPHSLTTETDPNVHRGLRRILNPYFSKRSVDQLSSLVLSKIERLETKLRRIDRPFDAHNAVM